jgi:hypothetical protein
LARDDLRDESRQEAREVVEQHVDVGGAPARLPLVEQRVVGIEAERRRLRLRHLAGEVEHAREVGQQAVEVVRRARLAPAHLADRDRLRIGLDQLGRHGAGMRQLAAHLLDIGALPGIQRRRFRRGGGDQVAGLGRGERLVMHDAQGRDLLAARLDAARRHHRRVVPLEHAHRVAELEQPLEARLRLAVGRRNVQSHGITHASLPQPLSLLRPLYFVRRTYKT